MSDRIDEIKGKNKKITGEYMAGKLRMLEVDSSNIHSVGYDGDTKTLVVRFKSGTVYSYANVKPAVALAFMEADSHGSYFHTNIRDRFDSEQIDLSELPKSLRRDIKKEKKK